MPRWQQRCSSWRPHGPAPLCMTPRQGSGRAPRALLRRQRRRPMGLQALPQALGPAHWALRLGQQRSRRRRRPCRRRRQRRRRLPQAAGPGLCSRDAGSGALRLPACARASAECECSGRARRPGLPPYSLRKLGWRARVLGGSRKGSLPCAHGAALTWHAVTRPGSSCAWESAGRSLESCHVAAGRSVVC